MIVEVNTVEEFCVELRIDATYVLDKIVRVREESTPEQEEAISFQVGLWATTVIRRDSHDYILQFGGVAGSTDNEAAEIMNGWKEQINEVCDDYDLTIRHGKIEQF